MSEEKRNVEILNNIKEYMQNSIDRGYHKFIYNDLDWDEKCVDIINAIDYFIERVEQQQKEIEEKTTILLAGAEKVKQLEKGNRSLMESRKKWKNRYYKEKAKNKERDRYNITTLPFEELKEMIEQNKNISIFGKDYISKDKIRAKIKKYDKWILEGGDYIESLEAQRYALNELLEEN